MAAELETLTYGYGLIEGPRVDEEDNLYFSDVPNGGVYRRSPDGEVTTEIPKRRGVGGIALHAEGGLVVGGRNIQHVVDGRSRVLFETDAAGFNDLFVDAQGRVLVGTLRQNPFEEQMVGAPGECWRIEAEGRAVEVYGDVTLTNGIAFSPDGSRIYHSDSGKNHIICHDVEGDTFTNRRALAEDPSFLPDGLAVDEAGSIWVADFYGSCVAVLDPDGNRIDTVAVPAESVTSVCFGGADRRDLYIVTADNTEDPARGGTVFRTRVDVPGLAVPKATI